MIVVYLVCTSVSVANVESNSRVAYDNVHMPRGEPAAGVITHVTRPSPSIKQNGEKWYATTFRPDIETIANRYCCPSK